MFTLKSDISWLQASYEEWCFWCCKLLFHWFEFWVPGIPFVALVRFNMIVYILDDRWKFNLLMIMGFLVCTWQNSQCMCLKRSYLQHTECISFKISEQHCLIIFKMFFLRVFNNHNVIYKIISLNLGTSHPMCIDGPVIGICYLFIMHLYIL